MHHRQKFLESIIIIIIIIIIIEDPKEIRKIHD
jgi:hypothetical protein